MRYFIRHNGKTTEVNKNKYFRTKKTENYILQEEGQEEGKFGTREKYKLLILTPTIKLK